MGSSPPTRHPNTMTTQWYVIMDTGIHPVGPSPGSYSECLLLSSELYTEMACLYICTQVTVTSIKMGIAEKPISASHP